MDYQSIARRNEKLLAEDEKKELESTINAPIASTTVNAVTSKKVAENKTRAIAPVQQSPLIKSGQEIIEPRGSCSACLHEYIIPLTCLIFVGMCVIGGTYCKQDQRCLYRRNADSSLNGTTPDNAMLHVWHSNLPFQEQNNTVLFARGSMKTKKHMLHPIKNRLWKTRKR